MLLTIISSLASSPSTCCEYDAVGGDSETYLIDQYLVRNKTWYNRFLLPILPHVHMLRQGQQPRRRLPLTLVVAPILVKALCHHGASRLLHSRQTSTGAS